MRPLQLPPEGYCVDQGAMNRDLAMGKSKMDVMRSVTTTVMMLKSKYENIQKATGER